jgi:hypothetical protein
MPEAEITTRRHLFDGVFDYVFMHFIKGRVWENNVLFTKVYCKQAMYSMSQLSLIDTTVTFSNGTKKCQKITLISLSKFVSTTSIL